MSEHQRTIDDAIREALHGLPRVNASDTFNQQVLARTREGATQRDPWWPRLAAAAVLLAVVTGGTMIAREQLRERAYTERRAALEAQHEELRRELAAIRERATQPPRIYVGSGPDVDLVVDLEPWMGTSSVRPAAYRKP